jgi:hypothetical protein
MKSCSYCGRQNDEGATLCPECGAMVALCSGYFLGGFALALQAGLAVLMGFPLAGHERQVAAAAIAALISVITGIAVQRQIAVLKETC